MKVLSYEEKQVKKINYRHRLTQINTDDKNQQCQT